MTAFAAFAAPSRTRRSRPRARSAAACIAAALAATPLAAEGVSTPQEAAAEFTASMETGLRASTLGEAKKCAGYWWALQLVQENSTEVPFWQNLPDRFSAETSKLGFDYYGEVVLEAVQGDQARVHKANQDIFDYRQEAIQRVVSAEQTGGIEGFFSTLGYCVPE